MATVTNRLAALILAATATVTVAACSVGGDAGDDKAGGPGPPVELRLANTGGSIDQTPAVEYFVERVQDLSGGKVRIEVVDQWADFAPDAEQQVVRDVAAGDVDLGWVGSRVFDTLGVKSFQALTAPMLIDSYALEDAVIESGVTHKMLAGLDELEVLGLAVLGDALRRPMGVDAPIVAPADWKGTSFGTLKSDGQVEAIGALGGDPVEIFGPHRRDALDDGTLKGFEFGLLQYTDPQWSSRAPYVAANVHLWPQMDVVLANPERLDELSSKQRGWLEDAAGDAARRSAELANRDAWALDVACQGGARFAEASEADLAALRKAFEPVYASLVQHPDTKAFIARIQALKRSATPEPALAIPSECTGTAPQHATGRAGPAPSFLNGTYRWVLTQADADKIGDPETNYPHVNTITLKDGHLEGGCFGAKGGTYAVEDDRITFDSVEYDPNVTAHFALDQDGNLHLTPVRPIDPGDAFECFYKPWTKID
jgi:TRAP-type C4-dicarboxylate transport system substrate-binding protein